MHSDTPHPTAAAARTMRLLLRAEEALIFGVCILAWHLLIPISGWWFWGLLLAPDLSMLGYLAGPAAGAWCYNAVHHRAPWLLALGVGIASGTGWLAAAGVIGLAHIGMDRMLGYGLKYTTGFKDTHLGRL